jgi:transcriptional regulator with XRE-family HTH domain
MSEKRPPVSPIGRNVLEYFEEARRRDPALQAEYDRLGPRFEVIAEIARARKRLGITQREMAQRMGVSQPVVARLLSGEQSPRIDTVAAAAAALECDLVIAFRPRAASTQRPTSRLAGVAEESPAYRAEPPAAARTPRTPAATRAPRRPRGGGTSR